MHTQPATLVTGSRNIYWVVTLVCILYIDLVKYNCIEFWQHSILSSTIITLRYLLLWFCLTGDTFHSADSLKRQYYLCGEVMYGINMCCWQESKTKYSFMYAKSFEYICIYKPSLSTYLPTCSRTGCQQIPKGLAPWSKTLYGHLGRNNAPRYSAYIYKSVFS